MASASVHAARSAKDKEVLAANVEAFLTKNN